MKQEDLKKIQAFEMKMLRRILQIPWTAHRTNESILQETGYRKELLGTIKKRKLTYLGHIMRKQGENLEKTVIQGSVPGKRSRGRPRKTWIADIIEWIFWGLIKASFLSDAEKLTDSLQSVEVAYMHTFACT